MIKFNDEKDILNYYQQDIYQIDETVKDQWLVKSLGPRIKLISCDCNLPLDIRSLVIPQDQTNLTPSIIKKTQSIEYLSAPSRLIKKIYNESSIKELRALIINSGNFKAPDDFILNKLELISSSNLIRFKQWNFPNLRSIRCKCDDFIIDVINSLQSITCIAFSSVKNNFFDKIINITELETLYINSGTISNIDNIGYLRNLRKLSLINLNKITDLNPILCLDKLTELQIGYCNHIKDWDFLLDLPHLSYLNIPFSSKKNKPPINIINALIQNGIKVI